MVNFKMIGNTMYEQLEVLVFGPEDTHYIIRQNDIAVLYPGYGRDFFHMEDLESEIEAIENTTYIDEEIKTKRIEHFKNSIKLIKKHNRNYNIDVLVGDRTPMSLDGLSPLVFAC